MVYALVVAEAGSAYTFLLLVCIDRSIVYAVRLPQISFSVVLSTEIVPDLLFDSLRSLCLCIRRNFVYVFVCQSYDPSHVLARLHREHCILP